MRLSLARRADRGSRWLIPLAALIGCLAVRVSGSSWVEGIQHRAFDVFLNEAPRPYVDAGVRVIDVDEESLARIGQWPWPRTQIAQLIRRLTDRGVKVVAFDAMYPEPDRTSPARVAAQWPDQPGMAEIKARVSRLQDHDLYLAEEIKRAARSAHAAVVLGFAPDNGSREHLPEAKAAFAFSGSARTLKGGDVAGSVGGNDDSAYDFLSAYSGTISNLPALEHAAQGLGSIGFAPEHDGIIRRAPLIFRIGEQLYPSLALEALRTAQDTRQISVKLGSSGATLAEHILDQAGIKKIKVGRYIIPTDSEGRIWVHYTAEIGTKSPRTLPAWKVMDPKAAIAGLNGTIVFIGTSAQGLKDLRSTPLNPAEAGVQVHANIAEQVLLGEFLERPVRADRLEVVATALAGLILLGLLLRVGAGWSAPVGLAMIASSLWISWHAFTAWHWLVDPVFPCVSLAAVFVSFAAVGYVRSDREKRRITDTFGRYLSPKVVAELAKNPGKVQLGGETRVMTFHFCDIRGFTTISEKFDPHGLTEFINRFLTPMTQIILEHDGTIDKYMGDCIMAFWNAPMTVADHPRRACAAALKMHARLKELNAQWQADAKAKGIDLPEIHIGTGLNTGPCVVGNMGSTLRVDYTVLGDDVNLASRLEGQSKSYGVNIVIGPTTREQSSDYAAIELDLIKVKGKTKPVHIFALLGTPEEAAAEPFLSYEKTHAAMLAAYRAQKWDDAARLMDEARAQGETWHLGKLYDLYAERLAAFRAEPPPADWDGVFTATSK
ncbi:MAG: CHASE2 domain-containing protein [Elusimicrobiota bacterium]